MLKFSDVAVDKIESIIKKKYQEISPCRPFEWSDVLKSYGIDDNNSFKNESELLKVSNPMGIIHENGSDMTMSYGLLYIPKELALKILTLGYLTRN